MKTPIGLSTLTANEKVQSKGVMQALRCLCSGKALDIIEAVPDRGGGFEAWRRLWGEYRPSTSGRKASMMESIMEDRPKPGEKLSASGTTGG